MRESRGFGILRELGVSWELREGAATAQLVAGVVRESLQSQFVRHKCLARRAPGERVECNNEQTKGKPGSTGKRPGNCKVSVRVSHGEREQVG